MRKLTILCLLMAAMCALSGLWQGCTPDNYADERSVKLEFSTDTLSFDTVFSTMGTAVRRLTVYNRSSSDIELSSVTLLRGRQSRFRLNVDGDTSMVARNIELQGGDSLFIFVQACIDPTEGTAPFLRTDSILFGNGQAVPVVAYGRNAVYHQLADADSWFSRIDCDGWDHSRPHVFLSPAAIMEGTSLTLQPGEELYFADGAMLIVDSMASLYALGTEDDPILFSSVRREEWYRHLPGQWLFIWFYNGALPSIIDHAVIENATAGLRCYPGSELSLSNSIICQMSDAGIVGQDATIDGHNLLVFDCHSSVALISGGDYRFDGCTFADYWNYRGKMRDTSAVIVSNYYPMPDGSYVAADMRRAAFSNCIIYGSYRNELSVNAMPPFVMNHSVVNSIVRGGEWDEDPMFESVVDDDYRLQEGSPAEGIGYTFTDGAARSRKLR